MQASKKMTCPVCGECKELFYKIGAIFVDICSSNYNYSYSRGEKISEYFSFLELSTRKKRAVKKAFGKHKEVGR